MARRRSPNWGGARANRSPHARPTVKRIELDPDVARVVRAACINRHGVAGKTEVTQCVNDLLRYVLGQPPDAGWPPPRPRAPPTTAGRRAGGPTGAGVPVG